MAQRVNSRLSEQQRRRQTEDSSQNPVHRPAPLGPEADILALQDAAGNRAVDQLLQSEPDSHHAMRFVPPIVFSALNRGNGHPLESTTRAFMEAGFGEDLSQVRIHTDAQAAESAETVNALAYTIGDDIVFGPGQYAPTTHIGQQLLAHELAHVVQQQAIGPKMQLASKQTPGVAKESEALRTPKGFLIEVQVTLSLKKKVRAAGVDIEGFKYKILREPPGGINRAEGAALYKTILQAQQDIRESPIYSEYLKPIQEHDQVEFIIQIRQDNLWSEQLRRTQETRISDAIRDALHRARVAETFRKPKPPEHKVEFAQERIKRVREGITRGYKQEGEAEAAAARRITAWSVSPDIRWNTAEWYLQTAERALANNDLDTANVFIDLGEKAHQGNEQMLESHEARYAFGDQVVAPVLWKATEILGAGLVDKELFDTARTSAQQGSVALVAAIGLQLVKRISNILTFGGGPMAYEKAVEAWEAYPDDRLAAAIAAGGEGFARGLIDNLLPVSEFATLADEKVIDPETGQSRDPNFWDKMGAFFSAILKVVSLGMMAKGKAKSRPKGKIETQGSDVKSKVPPAETRTTPIEPIRPFNKPEAQPLPKPLAQEETAPLKVAPVERVPSQEKTPPAVEVAEREEKVAQSRPPQLLTKQVESAEISKTAELPDVAAPPTKAESAKVTTELAPIPQETVPAGVTPAQVEKTSTTKGMTSTVKPSVLQTGEVPLQDPLESLGYLGPIRITPLVPI